MPRPRWQTGISPPPAAGPTRPSRRDRLVLGVALTTRARVAIAQGEPDQAERDAHDALTSAAEIEAYLAFPTPSSASPLWPATPAVTAKPPGFSARQQAIRQRMGAVRFKI